MKTKRFLNLRKPRSAPSPRGAWRFWRAARRTRRWRFPWRRLPRTSLPRSSSPWRSPRSPRRAAAARARTRSWTRSRRRSRRRRRSSSPSPARSRRRSRFRGTWGKIRDPPKRLFAIRRATRWKVPSRGCGTRKIGVCGWRRSRGRRPRVPCAKARTGPPRRDGDAELRHRVPPAPRGDGRARGRRRAARRGQHRRRRRRAASNRDGNHDARDRLERRRSRRRRRRRPNFANEEIAPPREESSAAPRDDHHPRARVGDVAARVGARRRCARRPGG